jgi:hypothetical protein
VVALINIFFIPTDRRLLPIIQKHWRTPVTASLAGGSGADLPALGTRGGFRRCVHGILLIAAIFFMTTKPGLG